MKMKEFFEVVQDLGILWFVIMLLLFFSYFVVEDNQGELGQAICEEEYDMDLDYVGGFFTPVPVCEPKEANMEVEMDYDGIKVRITDGVD